MNKQPAWSAPTKSAYLTLTGYKADVLQEEHGFGGFLFDTAGRLFVVGNGWTWLYTTRVVDGRWESWARRFHPETLRRGPARLVLLPAENRDRAVLHHVISVAEDFYVGFLCDGIGITVATATAPNGDFTIDPEFTLYPEIGWETRNGPVDGWSLESNGAMVPVSEDTDSVVFWQGYDSYRKDGGFGELGWARLRIHRKTRRVELLERHSDNPVQFLQEGSLCARCGGNLDHDIRIGGKHAFFFYTRPTRGTLKLGLALSDDPLFFEDVLIEIFDSLFGDEQVAEKFEAMQYGDELYLFYESMIKDKTWRTGVRTYRLD